MQRTRTAFLFFSCLLLLLGCEGPPCRPGEIKLADTCYPSPVSRDSGAKAASTDDDEADARRMTPKASADASVSRKVDGGRTELAGCTPNPCQNGGVCSDEPSGVICACTTEYDGERCETRVDADTTIDAGTRTVDGDRPTVDGGIATPVMPIDRAPSPDASKLPKVRGECPTFQDGEFKVMGTTGRFWVGEGPGPLVFYWHGTGSTSSEVATGLPGVTQEIKRGGIVASFEKTNGRNENTLNDVWFTGDFDAADQILACGLEMGLVDSTRIYAAGYSAGGVQTGAMLFARSNYMAAVVIYSGGPALGGSAPNALVFKDPSNIPASLGAHGAQGSDWLAIDFSDATYLVGQTIKKAGGFAIDCDDGGSHVDFFTTRAGVGGKAWQFLKDHPYKTKPSPYAGGLAGFPRNCKIL